MAGRRNGTHLEHKRLEKRAHRGERPAVAEVRQLLPPVRLERHYTDQSLAEMSGRSESFWKKERRERRLRFIVIERPGYKRGLVQIPESAVIDWYQRYGREYPAVGDLEEELQDA